MKIILILLIIYFIFGLTFVLYTHHVNKKLKQKNPLGLVFVFLIWPFFTKALLKGLTDGFINRLALRVYPIIKQKMKEENIEEEMMSSFNSNNMNFSEEENNNLNGCVCKDNLSNNDME